MDQVLGLQSQPSANLDILHSGTNQIPYQHHSSHAVNLFQNGQLNEYHNIHPSNSNDPGEPNPHETINPDSGTPSELSNDSAQLTHDMNIEQRQPLSFPHQESSSGPYVPYTATASMLHTDADTMGSGQYENRSAASLNSYPPSSPVLCTESPDPGDQIESPQTRVEPRSSERVHMTDGGGASLSSVTSNDTDHPSGALGDHMGQHTANTSSNRQMGGTITIQGVDVSQKVRIPDLDNEVQINITNAAKTVQIGSNNVMHVQQGPAGVQTATSNSRENKKRVDIKIPKRRIEGSDIDKITQHLGKDWRRLGVRLGFVPGELDAFQHDSAHAGLREIIFQMMLAWRQKMGPEAFLRVIVQELLAIKRSDVAKLFHEGNL